MVLETFDFSEAVINNCSNLQSCVERLLVGIVYMKITCIIRDWHDVSDAFRCYIE